MTDRAYTFNGEPLREGYNLDPISVEAGLAMARRIGYSDGEAQMVAGYALWRHARGEEDGAERTWLGQYPNDFTSWRMILAAAMADA